MSGEAGFGLTGSGAEPLGSDDPRRIGPIPLLGRLGVGGMGRVYLGVHEGRYAAVKQVLPSVAGEDEDFLRRFGHELDNLARLPEEATAPLLVGDRDARPPWFATAYVPGITLREAVDLHGPLPAEALWLILREAATALASVHALDMVHRDLKPSNVMLTLDGLTLIDFGVARAADQSQLTRTGMVVGTPAYMSPEQASGKRASSGVVDVFALGSVIAYAASGRPPFGDESGHAVLYRIVHEEPDLQPLRELDAELADVVASCLDKDHEGRPTAAELVATAERHGPFTPPLWPEVVSGPLAERAAFASKVPGPVDMPEPDEAAPSLPSAPVALGGQREKRERRRRTKVLALVVPVVVTGATLSVTLLPYVMSESDKDRAAGTPPAATGTATPGPADSATGSTGPSASASGSPDDGKKDAEDKSKEKAGEEDGGQDGNGTASGGAGDAAAAGEASGGGSGSGASSGAGDSSSGEGASGSAGSSGSDGSSGSGSGSGASGGGGDGPEGGGSASGSFMLKNGSSGKCMYVGYPIDDGNCSGDMAVFRFQSTSGGAFRILNVGTAQCIHSRSANAWLVRAACGQAGGEWREGANGSLRNLTTGGCLDLNRRASMIGLTTTTCTGSASQRWTRI
ncbi:protein kinase [Streptomyces sp. NPDC017890]|uniref:serine/threonine-protein kinase n=1 Tax=Streptomyces sp. NPDC017890 TaxID=3365015 RepID=UPI00379C8B84